MVSFQVDGFTVYEVAINNPDRVGLMSATSKTKELASFEQTHGLKMLLFVDADNHVAKACYMLIEASTPEELEKVHYKQTNGLNGNVMYYNLNGTMSNGIAYVAGRPRHKLTQLPESEVMALKNGDGSRTVQGCTIHYIETGYTGCVGVGGYVNCQWYSTGYVGFSVCENGGSHVENDVEDDFEGGVPNYGQQPTVSVSIIKEIKVDTTARPCVDTITSAVISHAGEIQNVLSNLLSLANVNASAAITTMANSSTYKIKIGEHLFNDQIQS